jgi:SAM-dependent methyltransferase
VTETVVFTPRSPIGFDEVSFEKYLHNFLIEYKKLPFTEDERKMAEINLLGRFLDQSSRPFFFYHFSPLAVKAVKTLLEGRKHPHILDLGCGTGSMSILFALMGAKVTGLDRDVNMISMCEKRRKFYEEVVGPLDLEFRQADVPKFPFETLSQVDGMYSLFAFSWMRPNREVIGKLKNRLNPGAIILTSEGNEASLINRIRRKNPVLKPTEMKRAFEDEGFEDVRIEFDCILPHALAKSSSLVKVSHGLEDLLGFTGLIGLVAVSYTLCCTWPTSSRPIP